MDSSHTSSDNEEDLSDIFNAEIIDLPFNSEILTDSSFKQILIANGQRSPSPVPKIAPKAAVIEIVDIRQLEHVLNSVEGRNIIKFYNQNNILNENNRQTLVSIIITHEANKPGNEECLQITSSRFQQMTREIKCKFPNEPEFIYFRPYSKESHLPANGKLFAKYENYKKKHYLSKSKKTIFNLDNRNTQDLDNIKFLHNNIVPWDKIEELWEATFNVRKIEFSRNQTPLHTYLEKFPCLRQSCGYQLLELDFNNKYPDKINIFQNNCDAVCLNIFSFIKKQKINDSDVKSLIENYEKNPNVVTLLILPYLFKVTYGRKRNGDKTLLKHTKKEISESFILFVSVSILFSYNIIN